jgi:hypothetical protein
MRPGRLSATTYMRNPLLPHSVPWTCGPGLSNTYKGVPVLGVLSKNSPCTTKMYSDEPNISSAITPKLPGNELADRTSNETVWNPIRVIVHHMPDNAT